MNKKTEQCCHSENQTPGSSCCDNRRDFFRAGIGLSFLAANAIPSYAVQEVDNTVQTALFQTLQDGAWPILKQYPQTHIASISLPLGGIGTGTVSLGGRGDLRDWEIMNRPAKGFVPSRGEVYPFFALYVQDQNGKKITRLLEGPYDGFQFEGSHGCTVPNENLPRFQHCAFAAAYPFGQVMLTDPELPVEVKLKAFNPFVPYDADISGIPIAVLRYEIINKTNRTLQASVCGTIPNFIGMDGSEKTKDWKGDLYPVGAKKNKNRLVQSQSLTGIVMESDGVESKAEQYGNICLTTPNEGKITHRLDWSQKGWGASVLDFWDDFSADGMIDSRDISGDDIPVASLAVKIEIPAKKSKEIAFYLTWHFPNRYTWTPRGKEFEDEDRIGNYYSTVYPHSWDTAQTVVPKLDEYEQKTMQFVSQFCKSDLPDVVKEAALFNLSTLRTQTCFRTPDGRFYGYEGCGNEKGCCWGNCTHVWNYEQATAYLFGGLSKSMREIEFNHATDDAGVMSFRVHLPLSRAQEFAKAAADGQMGCIMKMYRDWQLSGDQSFLQDLYPGVKRALSFCWISGGWDADQDGVMEGCQHNTMDVEYYGPNPQMGVWYLGALRAAQEMAQAVGDQEFAAKCERLFHNGSKWIDQHLFNGEYYIHEVLPPQNAAAIAPSLLVGMGAKDPAKPEYQLAHGCLVDQLVGQYMAHVCGLGYLVQPENIQTALKSILKYNHRETMYNHFNSMRTFAAGNESALLMASYPYDRPENPFSYFTEVMTGFEYTAAVGLMYEGLEKEGLKCIKDIRERYDGLKRNPFNEAECGHHYARAMASWAAVLALTGFQYSGVTKQMQFTNKPGTYFWSNGSAWGTCRIKQKTNKHQIQLNIISGALELNSFSLQSGKSKRFDPIQRIEEGKTITFEV